MKYSALPGTYSGTGNATKTVALNGDQAIDGLLTTVAWGGTSIDYSFPTSNSVYGYATQTDLPGGFFGLSLAQQRAAQFVLDADLGVNALASAGFSAEGITNLRVNFDATPDKDQIRLANTTSSTLPTAQVADFPGNYVTSQTEDNGDVWFGTAYAGTINDYTAPEAGNYAWHAHIHEIGHALGLKHGHENSLDGPMPANVDSMEFSVMTYRSYIGGSVSGGYTNDQWGYAQSWMMYDIAALQHMYGADFTTNAGNTVYSWNPDSGDTLVNGIAGIEPGANRIFATIWDGGGTDTYDLSAYDANLSVNLAPGGYSTFSDVQRAYLGDGNYARGNIFNALQYHGDARSLIENAIGGSGNDTIAGNAAANNLQGGAGNDSLTGAAGADVLEGGGGVDREAGGDGNDRFVLHVGFEVGNVWDGGAGTDTFDFRAIGAGFLGISINLVSGYTDGAGTSSLVGIENVWGSDSAELIGGSTAANQLLGYGGNDTIGGNNGNDTLDGGAGNDSMGGGDGNDRLLGGAGNDSLFGGNGNDALLGGAGNDSLGGGAGADSLAGEAGNDVLGSGDGKDTLVGGAGQDRFDFNLVSEFPVGASCDVLQAGGGGNAFDGAGGTGPGGERIDLADLYAGTLTFGGTTKGHVWCVNAGNVTHVFANVDNDAAADFQLNILDLGVFASAYKAADFVL